jgi:Protein of unknown function (DUF3109)
MKNDNQRILRRHRLAHIPELRVEEGFLERKFASGCSMMHCNSSCCRHGVMVDLGERQRILDHKDLVLKYMEPQQEKDPRKWFDEDEEVDLDFPSGKTVGTQTRSYGCVFLDKAGRCALQKAAMAEGMHKFALKPFFCVAFPITIEHGVLVTDDPEFTEREECCSVVKEGSLTVLDVCHEELEFMLGREGLDDLKQSTGS